MPRPWSSPSLRTTPIRRSSNSFAKGAAREPALEWARRYQNPAIVSLLGPLHGSIEQQLFQIQDLPPGVDGMEFSLLQITAAQLAPQLSTDSLIHHIAALQRKESDWPNYGAARPPLEVGGFSHTAKGIRILRVYPIPGRQAEFDDRLERAARWLEAAEPRTTEDRTMQLLGITWAGQKAPSNRVQPCRSVAAPTSARFRLPPAKPTATVKISQRILETLG